MNQLIVILGVVIFSVNLALKLVGSWVAFKKKWWLGVLCLIVPFFAEIVFLFKVVLKIDLFEQLK